MWTDETDYGPESTLAGMAIRYAVMVFALTVGISILLGVVYEVHPMMLLADRVDQLVAGLR